METFDVEVVANPYDRDAVRSQALTVIPGPVEYLGYDDGGTPDDESDDNHLYYLRWYALYSGRDSSYGEIWLYDPDLERVKIWLVPVLQRVVHEECDGLTANPNGEVHGVIIPVPVSLMEKAGTYRFVLHFYDDYADTYRNYQVKAALEVNAPKIRPQASLYDYLGYGADAAGAFYLGKHLWENPNKKLPGYVAKALGQAANTDVFKRMPKDSVWYWCGHSDAGYFTLHGVISAQPGTRPPADSLSNHSMARCLLAIFHGCRTALTDTSPLNWGNLLDTAISIGAKCALGFRDDVGINVTRDHRTDNILPRAWSNWFFEALCWGKWRDHTATTVSEAAKYAAERIRNDCPSGNAHGFDSWETRPANSNLKVVSAR